MRPVIYMMHPLAPTAEEIEFAMERHGKPCSQEYAVRLALQRNIERALRWLAWLRRTFPSATFIAPWIATVQSLDGDDSPELREAGLVDDCEVVARCDGAVAVGGRWSSGMRREQTAAKAAQDLTHLDEEPPTGPSRLFVFGQAARS
jgi:hypothetical protein